MNTRERCERLAARLYRNVVLRDAALHRGIEAHLHPAARLLDAGCGKEAPVSAAFADHGVFCAGVDRVERFTPPPGVRLVQGDLNRLPFRDGSFDLVFSRSVFEHLEQPSRTFREVARVLRPGGRVVAVTPNKYDYASLAARLVPSRFHRFFLRTAAGEDVYDDFPTFFRCNTRRALRRAVAGTGLTLARLEYVRHYPYYLMFSLPLFWLGVAYDRIITRLRLDMLQPTLYVELEKEGGRPGA